MLLPKASLACHYLSKVGVNAIRRLRKLLHPSSWKIVFASLVSRVKVQQSGLLHQIVTFLTCQQVLSITSPLRASMKLSPQHRVDMAQLLVSIILHEQ